MNNLLALYHYLKVKYGPRFTTRADLRAWQAEQMERHVKWVQAHSPFYRTHWGELPREQWAAAPLVNKSLMMANFDTFNTLGITKGAAFTVARRAEQERDFAPTLRGVTVGLSSGTSGQRGLFLISNQERVRWAGAMLAKMLPAPLGVPQRVAFFLRANSNLYQSVRSRLLRFEYFDLLDPLPAHIVRLNVYQPTVLVGPPSLLRLLAEAQPAGQLAIHPRRVISVAEVLDPVEEQVIAAQFGGPIHQVYQATEGLLATTCRYGTLHVAEDIIVMQREPLSADGRSFVPIISDFHRQSQPIVRYRLDDVLTLRSTPCPCGSIFLALERIEGRCDDLFYVNSLGGGQVVIFPDFVRRVILHAAPVTAYHAVQHSPTHVEIAFTLPDDDYAHAEAAITQNWVALCARLGAVPPALTFARDLPVRAPTQKLKRVERRW